MLLRLAYDAVAPRNGGAKRLLPRTRSVAGSLQEVEWILHTSGDLLRRQEAYECRSQLYRERETIQCPTDLANGCDILSAWSEARLGRTGACDKQLSSC